MRPILHAGWSGCALCRYTAGDQFSGQRHGRRRQGRCQNGARPRYPPPFPCGFYAWPGRETPAPRSVLFFPLVANKARVISSHCGAKSSADHQVSMSPSVAKYCPCLPSPRSIPLTSPSCAMFTYDRLSSVVGIACATLWVWMEAQEVTNSAANAMMCFILAFLRICHFRQRPIWPAARYALRLRLARRLPPS